MNDIENLDAVRCVLNLRPSSFRYFGIQNPKLACVHLQLNRWAIGLLHFAGLNRCLNFMIVTKGGRKPLL